MRNRISPHFTVKPIFPVSKQVMYSPQVEHPKMQANASARDIQLPKLRRSYEEFGSMKDLQERMQPAPHLPTESPQRAVLLRAPDKDKAATESIFVVYSSLGLKSFKRYVGAGFLLTHELAITTKDVIPTEHHASKAYFSFLDEPDVLHQFDPRRFFLTNHELNFSIIALFLTRGEEMPRSPLPIHPYFTLKATDSLAVFFQQVESRNVTAVTTDSFSYPSIQKLPPGLPVFSYEWQLQGLHRTQGDGYMLNQATRIDSIYKYLFSIKHLLRNRELELMVQGDDFEDLNVRNPVQKDTAMAMNMYWFQWYSTIIFRYNLELEIWTKVKPIVQFGLSDQVNWYFHWNSRTCLTPSGSLLILGGVGDNRGTISDLALEYRPVDNTLNKLAHMLSPREALACICSDRFAYALGGRHQNYTCERVSLDTRKWEQIAPMVSGRYSHCACLLERGKYIYVVGGLPAEEVGSSIERYFTPHNTWEKLPILVPAPMVNFTLLSLNSRKLAMMGGKYTTRVFILENSEYEEHKYYSNDYVLKDTEAFRIYESTPFTEAIETLVPPFIDEQSETVKLMNGRDGFAHLKVTSYKIADFLSMAVPSQVRFRQHEDERFYVPDTRRR
jgi:hypothetical protein